MRDELEQLRTQIAELREAERKAREEALEAETSPPPESPIGRIVKRRKSATPRLSARATPLVSRQHVGLHLTLAF